MKLYPFMFDFLKSAYFENATEVFTEIKETNKKAYSVGFNSLFSNTDLSKFHDGINPQMVMKIISWCGEGFITELKIKDKIDVDDVCNKFDKYLELLKRSFYSVCD